MSVRHLILILGDQLDLDSAVLKRHSQQQDLVMMAEVTHEAKKVWSHKARIVLFLSAMRHFAEALREKGWQVDYQSLATHDYPDLASALYQAIRTHQPESVHMVRAGEYEINQSIQQLCREIQVPLKTFEDTHFLTSVEDFDQWQRGRKQWVMEYFYRFARKHTGYLMDDGKPIGDEWNLDKQNRQSFKKQGPGMLPPPMTFATDETTEAVINLVKHHFGDHPGKLTEFDWPVTRQQALQALDDFIQHRLIQFGPYQDAMWTAEPWLYHSRLSAALNLKLLNPREVLDAAIAAYERGDAPLNSTEGFVRQILGWREYVHHLYREMMPGLLTSNALHASQPLPEFYWTANTEMRCLQETLQQTLKYGYAHHIQRLMVTGLFALLLGVNPRRVHEWYLAIYVDAVEWVEAPNTIGMSQYADGGRLASKPYVASGKYIQRMSNYCQHCRYDSNKRTGEDACPFNILYWDFLMRHEKEFGKHPRTALQWRNLNRIDDSEKQQIRQDAEDFRQSFN